MMTLPIEPQNYTILIVDDNPTNLGVVSGYLKNFGFTILIARSGEKALKRIEHTRPDIILLDVMMPGLDGFETCRQLKANKATEHIPVIFMTALAETKDKVRGFEAGAVDYVTKPLQQEEVLARLTTHLRLRELTERLEQKVHERTEALNIAYHTLERLDKAKSEFIYIISHELRTPMTLIDGFTRLLQENEAITANEEVQELTAGILKGSRWMLETINHIFDATKIENDVLELYREEVELAVLIGEVCHGFQTALAQRQLTLTCHNLHRLPPIYGDVELLRKAFYHLIVNAIKYTPNGGQISIEGRVLEGPPCLAEIIIRDTGIGIDRDQLELIFEKFYQTGQAAVHSSGKTAFKGGGPGLGLSIARGIIVAHGGQIWAESGGHNEQTFPGSQFYVRLPECGKLPPEDAAS
jgi:signal transduction histidine kinase